MQSPPAAVAYLITATKSREVSVESGGLQENIRRECGESIRSEEDRCIDVIDGTACGGVNAEVVPSGKSDIEGDLTGNQIE
jgi:hypothetical protein